MVGTVHSTDATLSKGIQVLERLVAAPNSMGVTELSAALGLTKSNVHRLLQTLVHAGYVRQNDDKRYLPTLQLWKLGETVLRKLNLNDAAMPFMQSLRQQTGEAVYLAIRDGLSVLYIDKLESTQPIRAFTPRGGNAPLHCVATGKALLAFEYAELRGPMAERLDKFTDKTITTIEQLDKEVAKITKTNIAIDKGEYRERVYSIGSAIFGPGGNAIAAVGVSAPKTNLERGAVAKIAEVVHESAQGISDAINER